MKCEFCGNEIEYETTKCKYCGAPCQFIGRQNEKIAHEKQAETIVEQMTDVGDKEVRAMGKVDISCLNPNETPKGPSPCKRIVFLILGFFLGFLGAQFLYAKRYFSFALVLTCFVLSMIYRNSDWAPFEIFVMIGSFFAAFLVKTDGTGRKMKWF